MEYSYTIFVLKGKVPHQMSEQNISHDSLSDSKHIHAPLHCYTYKYIRYSDSKYIYHCTAT